MRDECHRINYNRFRIALDIQDAGNMAAIAREFVRVVDAAMRDTRSTTATWADPAVVLVINKLESLSRSDANFASAYAACLQAASTDPGQSASTPPANAISGSSR